MRSRHAASLAAVGGIVLLAGGAAHAAPRDEVRAAFSGFVVAQNAHDLKAVGKFLGDAPGFLWIDAGQAVRGRDGALERFARLFQGPWRIVPEWRTFQVVMLDASTAEIFVRVSIAEGALVRSMPLNQILVHTARGWRVSAIFAGEPPQR
jgi:ketosteroid isomerase-like protein